jgi:hypothetical protein
MPESSNFDEAIFSYAYGVSSKSKKNEGAERKWRQKGLSETKRLIADIAILWLAPVAPAD